MSLVSISLFPNTYQKFCVAWMCNLGYVRRRASGIEYQVDKKGEWLGIQSGENIITASVRRGERNRRGRARTCDTHEVLTAGEETNRSRCNEQLIV